MAQAVTTRDLEQFPLFRALTPQEQAKLLPICRWDEFQAEQTFLVEGESADTFYALYSGRVAVEMKVQFGAQAISRTATTQILESGQYCGWSSLVPPYIYTSSCIAIGPTRTISVDAKELRELVAAETHLGYEFMKTIARSISARMLRTRNTLINILSVLSHDLKAPLVAVQSYLQVIAAGFAGDVTDEQKDMLLRSSGRIDELLNLISDLLDVSRIETGRLEQEFKPMSLAAVARRSLAMVWSAAEAKSVELIYDLADGEATMVGADRRIEQVLNNLLNNAVKYTPADGKIDFEIIDNDSHWLVEVADTGIGIPEEDLPFIFSDFYRAKNAEASGSGLGLAIAKKIVVAHKGKIWVESPRKDTGTGTRFSFILPKNLTPYQRAKEASDE